MSERSRQRTGDQALLREINRSLIINQIRVHAPTSRAMLADMTGLNKTTVSSLVSELMQRQYVREIGYDTSGVGRPGVLLDLNPEAGYLLSCEIGVDFISLIRTDFSATIIDQHHEETTPHLTQSDILNRTLTLIRDEITSNAGEARILGLALAVPGLVDHATGKLLFAPNLGWQDVPLGDILREEFELPVYVDNEANLAALGEHYFGAGQGRDQVLYISVGVGLGGGIVRDGAIFRGKTGFAGEFGHMTYNPNGIQCNCGNFGCWETHVSSPAILRLIREAVARGETTQLLSDAKTNLDQLTIAAIAQAALDGDAVARSALERAARDLGVGAASLVNAFNPELILLGGIVSVAAEIILPIVENEIKKRALRWNAEAVEIALAEHGSNASLMGGIATIYQSILA